VLIIAGFIAGVLATRSGLLRSIKGIVIAYMPLLANSNKIIQNTTPPEVWLRSLKFKWNKYRYAYQFDQIEKLFKNAIEKKSLETEILKANAFQDFNSCQNSIEKLRIRFLDLLGGHELGNPNNVSLLEQDVAFISPSSELKRIVLQSRVEGIKVEAIVGMPVNSPSLFPPVIALHGYTSSPEKVMGLGEKDYSHNFGKVLLESGYFVVAPFILNHGERVSTIGALGALIGDTVWRIELIKVLSCLDYLQQRGDVDSARTGIYGISGGGMLALYATAVDRRIRCAVCSGHLRDKVKTLTDYALGRGIYKRSGYSFRCDSFFAGASFHIDFPSSVIAKMAMPTPIMFENGIMDRDLVEYNDELEFKKVREFYDHFGFSQRIKFHRHNGAHETDVQIAAKWINEWMKKK